MSATDALYSFGMTLVIWSFRYIIIQTKLFGLLSTLLHVASLMSNCFQKWPSGASLHTLSKLYDGLMDPSPILRLCIALFAVAEGWLLHDIGWFVLFLINELLYSLTFLSYSFHQPASLYKEWSICDDEMLRYSLRTEMQPIRHRLTWPLTFCLKDQYAASFYRSRIKYGVRSFDAQNHWDRKNDLFLGQSDLDHRAIVPCLYVNLPIDIWYQYQYVAQSDRLNYMYGIITTCLWTCFAYQCDITEEKELGLIGNDVTWTLLFLKMNISYFLNLQFIQFIKNLFQQVTEMKQNRESTEGYSKSKKEIIHPFLTYNFLNLPQLEWRLVNIIALLRNAYFCYKLRLYTFNIQFI